MRYWMVKFAPFRVSWEDILASGKFEIYSVRNPQSRNNLERMKLGDLVLYYHSQTDKQVMGIMQVIREAHQDFTTSDPRWKSVTFEPIETLKRPIPLQTIKEEGQLNHIALVHQPRLAVSELTKVEFDTIKNLSSQ